MFFQGIKKIYFVFFVVPKVVLPASTSCFIVHSNVLSEQGSKM